LASLLAANAMTRLPLVGREALVELVTADIAAAALEAPAGADAIAGAIERLFGPDAALAREGLRLPPGARLREVYAALVASDQFRAACGRISPSYAWEWAVRTLGLARPTPHSLYGVMDCSRRGRPGPADTIS